MLRDIWVSTVKFGFRLLYNELAWTYDAVSWTVSLGHWRKWQLTALQYVQGERVLEVAHGPGHMLVELSKRGYQTAGIDLSAAMGQQAAANLRQHSLTIQKNVPLVRSQVQALPFAAASFDTVLSQFPTAFIIEPETLAAVYRVLKPDGRLVILPEGHLTGTGLVHNTLDWLFKITGQRPDDQTIQAALWHQFEGVLQSVGFETAVHQHQLEGSVATVIVATKKRS